MHKAACQKSMTEGFKSFEDLTIKQLKTVFSNKVHKSYKKKEDKLMRKMEKIVEKAELIKFISEYVEFSEVSSLLITPKTDDKYAHVANKYKSKSIKFDGSQAKPSAGQMKEQANMMRSNPDLVRKANPAFANYTDQQIRQLADELDQMASNPEQLKEMERMFSMSNDDRNVLQSIQEGLTGQRPIDNDWIDNIVMTLKNNPEVFKTLFKSGASRAGADAGVSPDQIESFIDFASRLDAWILKMIAHTLWFLSKLVKPAQDLYKLMDTYTFGAAKYIFMMVFAMLSYYVMFGLVHMFRWLFVHLFNFGTFLYAKINGNALPAAASTTAAAVGKVVSDAAQQTANAAAGTADEFNF